jgi:type IV pilus assembly protein PilM
VFSKSKDKTIVGLDVEAGSIAATEVSANGSVRVASHGILPLAPGIFRDGEVADPEALGDAFKELFARHKLAKTVRLGIASRRVAVRTLHLPPIESADELEAAIRFQAQDHIPMPLDQAVLDWEVVGHTIAANGERRTHVVAVAARRDMLAASMEALNRAGLRPVGIDLSAFGMIRAFGDLAPAGEPADTPPIPYEQRPDGTGEPAAEPVKPAHLFCSLGDVLNLAVTQGKSCLFARISSFGIESIAERLAERRELTLEHARQWIGHVGLAAPVEEIEGDPEIAAAAREALAEGTGKLVDELRLSLEYYGAQEGAVAVEGVIACGPGTTIPGLVERLQRELGYPFTITRPAALAHLDPAVAARLTLPYGLALEG